MTSPYGLVGEGVGVGLGAGVGEGLGVGVGEGEGLGLGVEGDGFGCVGIAMCFLLLHDTEIQPTHQPIHIDG